MNGPGPGARRLVSDPSHALDSGRARQNGVADSGSAERSFNGEETIVASSPLHRTAARLEAHLIVIAHPLEHCLGRRYSLKPGTVLVHKPFTMKLLSAKLREVLGNPAPA